MPDTGCLILSLFSVVLGVALFLFPHPLKQLSGTLNRTLVTLDESLMRYRYVIGGLLFLLSYGLFRVALLVPTLRG